MGTDLAATLLLILATRCGAAAPRAILDLVARLEQHRAESIPG